MIRALLLCGLFAAPAMAQEATTARGGVIRVLDKTTGAIVDLELTNGEDRAIGHLTIHLGECRYPTNNPSGDAFVWLEIYYQNGAEPIFRGWMIATAPALEALDHPRYDVWALRCLTDQAPAE